MAGIVAAENATRDPSRRSGSFVGGCGGGSASTYLGSLPRYKSLRYRRGKRNIIFFFKSEANNMTVIHHASKDQHHV
jgi:hypothetical protein